MIELIQAYLIVSLIIYFFPFLLSLLTGYRTGSVFVMNLFLGWTFIGWIWALVWAVTPERKRDNVIVHNHISNEKNTDLEHQKVQQKSSSNEPLDKTALLNQLSQLHSLRQNNVITEDIYQKEKQDILDKLQPEIKSEPKTDYEETSAVEKKQQKNFDEQISKDDEYHRLFGSDAKKRNRKTWIIGSSIVVVFAASIYYFYRTSNPTSNSKVDTNSIIKTFENWQQQQIEKGNIFKNCPEYGSEEARNIIDNYDYDNQLSNRWGFDDNLQVFYSDFNGDNIKDAIVVYTLKDCLYGNGYVGDPEHSLFIVSKDGNYIAETAISSDMYSKLNKLSKKNMGTNTELAFIHITGIDKDCVVGSFEDWRKNDAPGFPSIKKYFKYNPSTKKLQVNNDDTFLED